MKKAVTRWYLYDFANSFASVVLLFYYPLILSDRGAADAWIGVSASIATGILLLILPYLGTYSDKTGSRLFLIRIGSFLMFVSIVSLAFLLRGHSGFSSWLLVLISFLYVLFQVCFQGSYVFYSSMLRQIAGPEENAKVSGVGLALGQLGNASALAIYGPIVAAPIIILGLSGKTLPFVLGGILFALLAWPFLRQPEIRLQNLMPRFSYRRFIKDIASERRAFYFLIGYSLLSDAILTFQLYLAIYVRKVFSFSDQMVSYLAISGLVFTVIGGFLVSRLAKSFRSEEKTLRLSALFYAICFGLCALMPQAPLVVFAVIAACGVSYSLVFALARTVYSKIAPADRQGEFFSVFTVFERVASVIGPLAWLATFYLLSRFGEDIQYRGSVFFLMAICLAGIYYLKKSQRQTSTTID